ncbi:hypothetical protein Pst134EA_019192 [Puccinia striiformis f. sp. tritici]|uniref:hypothetical protein n=1 Tax=Puccinia striiformis f. sp. tritici TaxID=168172 RepID=UPI0020071F75|nr:hypothetical protein Pst134EA_019192 [Puccinia striiformis f. sp. tritici]KAH9459042.1 hypothetical protein Pst134EA_019192 [Puccinia striiformis f. sp. tritici]
MKKRHISNATTTMYMTTNSTRCHFRHDVKDCNYPSSRTPSMRYAISLDVPRNQQLSINAAINQFSLPRVEQRYIDVVASITNDIWTHQRRWKLIRKSRSITSRLVSTFARGDALSWVQHRD